MKYIKIIRVLLALFLIFSCQKKSSNGNRVLADKDSIFKTIVIDPDDIDKKNMVSLINMAGISGIADSVTYIPLQTEDYCLIGEITEIIVHNDRFYIFDRMTESVLCFNMDGKFIHKISKQGNGPEEYPRISNFTVCQETGDIYIHSDVGQAFYVYTKDGDFIRKIPTSLLIGAFAVQKKDTLLCYSGKLWNKSFYASTFPTQYRYTVLHEGKSLHQQLKFVYNKRNDLIPLSSHNFSFYRDTVLLTEFMSPEIYSIDNNGQLIPKYRIEFTTNKFHLSFDEDINQAEMDAAEKSGRLSMLSSFYETDDYLLLNYTRKLYGMAYVNKHDSTVRNMGYFLFDDINNIPMSITILTVDNNGYLYKKHEPDLFIQQVQQIKKSGKIIPSSHLQEIAEKLDDISNPIIVKIKLKKS